MKYITKNIDNYSDNFTEYITKKYDLQSQECHEVRIPLIDKEELQSFGWNIGLICGASGTGKSTIIKELFKESIITPSYDESKPICSQFSELKPEEVSELFESVSLSSIPVWLRKPSNLSVGEKSRLDLAYHIINTPKGYPIVIDEYSSTINREAAMSLSHTLQRYAREHNLKIILVACHMDIIEYLQPDWIFCLNKTNPQLERIVYEGNPYVTYQTIDEKDILSKKMKI